MAQPINEYKVLVFLEDLGVDGRVILKWILKRQCGLL
jgi:hypothetical protein